MKNSGSNYGSLVVCLSATWSLREEKKENERKPKRRESVNSMSKCDYNGCEKHGEYHIQNDGVYCYSHVGIRVVEIARKKKERE